MASSKDFIVKNGIQILGTGSSTATNVTSGALIVNGGAGFNGSIYALNIFSNNNQVLTTATLGNYGVSSLSAGTDTAISASTGSITIWNTSTLQSITARGSSTNQIITITNVTASTSTTTGALQVAGGVGVGGNLNVGGVITATNLYVGVWPVTTGSGGFSNPFSSIFTITNTTAATSTKTGALQVAGGIGVGGSIYSSGTVTAGQIVANGSLSTSTNTGAISYGGSIGFTDQNIMGSFVANSPGYAQVIIENINSGSNASADIFIANNLNPSGYNLLDLGINSSNYAGTGTFNIPNAGYVMMNGGDLSIGTKDNNSIHFTINNQDIAPDVVTISTITTSVNILFTTQAISTTTGALVVSGGVGIGGGLYVGNNIQVGANTNTGAASVITSATELTLGSTGDTFGPIYLRMQNRTGQNGPLFDASNSSQALVDFSFKTATSQQNIRFETRGSINNFVPGNSSGYEFQIGAPAGPTLAISASSVYVRSSTGTVSSTTGALIVGGGVGIAGGLFVYGAITATTATIGGASVWTTATLNNLNQLTNGPGYLTSATLGQYGVSSIVAGAGISVSPTAGTGTVTVSSTATLQLVTSYGSSTNQVITITNTATSTSTTTGALVVSGGVGIGGNLYVSGGIVAQQLTIQYTTVTTSIIVTPDVFTITNTTQASSTVSGALVVTGGAGIGGNLYVGGNINVSGTINATINGIATTATNLASGAAGNIPIQTAAGLTSFIASGTAGYILQYQTGNTATWVNTSTLLVGNALLATSATNIVGGSLGAIPIQTGPNSTSFISSGTTGQILSWSGNTATWISTGSLTAGIATTATNIAGGAPGLIPVQSAPGVTSFINTGAVGTLLQMQVNNTASFVSTTTLLVGVALYANTASSAAFATGAGTATNISGGLPGWIPIQNSANVTSWITTASVTAGAILTWNGTTATWATTSSLVAGNATTATNIAGGQAGFIHIQSAPGVTSFINTGPVGYVLQMAVNNTATWVSTSSLGIGGGSGLVSPYSGIFTITNTTQATSTSTGALQVQGGIGVAGNIFAGGVITATNLYVGPWAVSTATGIGSTVYISDTPPTGVSSGTLWFDSSIATLRIYYIDPNGAQWVDANSGYVSSSTSGSSSFTGTATTATNIAGGTAGLIPIQSAPGVTSFINTGTVGYVLQMAVNNTATWVSTSSLGIGGSSSAISPYSGIFTITNTTQATTTNTGALQVAGGVGIGGNLFVGGNLTVTGTLFASVSGSITTATNIAGGVSGLIPVQSAAGVTSFINTGAVGTLLQMQVNNTATFVSTTTLQVGNALYATTATTATNVAGGTAGLIPIQSAPGVTSFINTGSVGYVLQMAVNNTATWVSTSSLGIGGGTGGGISNPYSGIFTITNTTTSVSTNTGALQVQGGVGVGGNLNVGGTIYSNGAQVLPTSIQEFTATAGQTTFTFSGGYTVGSLMVHANGVLMSSADYTASNGSTIVFAVGRNAGDIIRVSGGVTSTSINQMQAFSIAMSIALG